MMFPVFGSSTEQKTMMTFLILCYLTTCPLRHKSPIFLQVSVFTCHSIWLMISSQLLVVLLVISLCGDLMGDQFYDGCGGRNVLSLSHCVHYAILERLQYVQQSTHNQQKPCKHNTHHSMNDYRLQQIHMQWTCLFTNWSNRRVDCFISA